jgi:hypothetical protein
VEQQLAEEKFLLHATLRLPWCPKRQLGDTTNDFAPDFFKKKSTKKTREFLRLQKIREIIEYIFLKKISKTIFSDRIGMYEGNFHTEIPLPPAGTTSCFSQGTVPYRVLSFLSEIFSRCWSSPG